MILLEHTLPDGRQVHVIPLTFGRARLCLVQDQWNYSELW